MSGFTERLMRIVYFSKNRIDAPIAGMAGEIDSILAAAQANNARNGLTGALIFNHGVFGQVLEGLNDAVEETFERIQCDMRHHEVTILDLRPISERGFGGWSMGFVGADHMGAEIFRNLTGDPSYDARAFRGDALFEALRGLALRQELRDRAA